MTAAPLACQQCGVEARPSARFCDACGGALAPTVDAEYKQVTVLFADVVRSMDIAAALGPERLREVMADLVNRCAAVVRQFGGTLNQFTGDGIMALFGAPRTLEDHARRACLAALGIQAQTQRLAAELAENDGSFSSCELVSTQAWSSRAMSVQPRSRTRPRVSMLGWHRGWSRWRRRAG
jgi:adenylate cyclase